MVASVPDSEPRSRPRNRRWRAYQLAAEPESAVTIALSGNRCDSSQHDAHRVDRVGVDHGLALHGVPPRGHVRPRPSPARSGRSCAPAGGAAPRSVGGGVADEVDLGRVPHPDQRAVDVDLHRAGLAELRQELACRGSWSRRSAACRSRASARSWAGCRAARSRRSRRAARRTARPCPAAPWPPRPRCVSATAVSLGRAARRPGRPGSATRSPALRISAARVSSASSGSTVPARRSPAALDGTCLNACSGGS